MNHNRINWDTVGKHPIIWYFISLLTIVCGYWLFTDADPENKFQAAFATLLISLGTTSIIRVRTPVKDQVQPERLAKIKAEAKQVAKQDAKDAAENRRIAERETIEETIKQ